MAYGLQRPLMARGWHIRSWGTSQNPVSGQRFAQGTKQRLLSDVSAKCPADCIGGYARHWGSFRVGDNSFPIDSQPVMRSGMTGGALLPHTGNKAQGDN
jgi:hypothetical protein